VSTDRSRSDRPLDGRVAIVTGAAQGIGRAHALELARLGAAVVVNDLGTRADGEGSDRSAAQVVVDEIVASGGAAIADGTDVADFSAVGDMVERTVSVLGGLDVMITNAGILRDRTIASMSEAEWDVVMSVHLKGTFAPAHHAAAYWRSRSKQGVSRPGRLITTSSASGIYGNVGQANYGSAKAGIAAFTVIAAMELERYGVTANCLAPSAMTRLTEPIIEAQGGPLDQLRRELDPVWVARVAGWLCTDAAEHVTGRVFDVRGSSVSVAQGWRLGPVATQPDDPDGLSAVLAALVAEAPPNASMDGTVPT
jgi:NAD(P)-dependent dehydrogenase (short-subunit alcohol dehydrogenase family)